MKNVIVLGFLGLAVVSGCSGAAPSPDDSAGASEGELAKRRDARLLGTWKGAGHDLLFYGDGSIDVAGSEKQGRWTTSAGSLSISGSAASKLGATKWSYRVAGDALELRAGSRALTLTFDPDADPENDDGWASADTLTRRNEIACQKIADDAARTFALQREVAARSPDPAVDTDSGTVVRVFGDTQIYRAHLQVYDNHADPGSWPSHDTIRVRVDASGGKCKVLAVAGIDSYM